MESDRVEVDNIEVQNSNSKPNGYPMTEIFPGCYSITVTGFYESYDFFAPAPTWLKRE